MDTGSGGGVASSRNRRKGGRPPKFRESYLRYDSAVSEDELDENNSDELVDSKASVGHMHDEDHGTKAEDAGAESLNADRRSLKVKEEPVDTGYEKASGSNCLSSSSSSASVSRNSPSPKPKPTSAANTSSSNQHKSNKSMRDVSRSHGGRVSPVAGSSSSAGQTINSVADLLSVRRELSETSTRLTETQTQNADLEARLEDAHKEIAQLRDTLRTRELQVTNLANSFFDLSNQFVRASQEFKQVMQSIQPPGEQYVPPQP